MAFCDIVVRCAQGSLSSNLLVEHMRGISAANMFWASRLHGISKRRSSRGSLEVKSMDHPIWSPSRMAWANELAGDEHPAIDSSIAAEAYYYSERTRPGLVDRSPERDGGSKQGIAFQRGK